MEQDVREDGVRDEAMELDIKDKMELEMRRRWIWI
jgi:hypothetical protein